MKMRRTRALIVVDVQNDFMPGGALPVVDGDRVVGPINTIAAEVHRGGGVVVATQDWHPLHHGSFAVEAGVEMFSEFDLNGLSQVAWPVHCLQGSYGSDLHIALDTRPFTAIFRKGMDPRVDSYSAFCDNGGQNDTGLGGYLTARGIDEVVVVGLATDYCVKYTALGALHRGFKVTVVDEACRAVGGVTGQQDTLRDLANHGVRVVATADDGI